MNETDENIDDAASIRKDITDELWGIVNDGDAPAAARVGALDRLAKIEGAYKPAPKAKNNRYKSLADFYADVNAPAGDPAEDGGV